VEACRTIVATNQIAALSTSIAAVVVVAFAWKKTFNPLKIKNKTNISWHFRNVAENRLGWIFDYGRISSR
jgi:hypothetical protein